MHACFICKHCASVVPNDEQEAHFQWKCAKWGSFDEVGMKVANEKSVKVILNKLSFSLDNDNKVWYN